MAKKPKLTTEEEVLVFFEQMTHPLKEVVEALRSIVLESAPSIGEQIKWNSPSFFYTGEMKPFDPKTYQRDIVVFNLHKKDQVLLVFPTGAKVKDTSGLLEGKFTDTRKIAKFTSMEEVNRKAKALQAVINHWLDLVEL